MKKYQLRIREPNKIIQIRGRSVRTPLVSVIADEELPLIRSLIKFNSITDYEIEEFELGKKHIITKPTNFEEIDRQEKEEKRRQKQLELEVLNYQKSKIESNKTVEVHQEQNEVSLSEQNYKKEVKIEELEEPMSILDILAQKE